MDAQFHHVRLGRKLYFVHFYTKNGEILDPERRKSKLSDFLRYFYVCCVSVSSPWPSGVILPSDDLLLTFSGGNVQDKHSGSPELPLLDFYHIFRTGLCFFDSSKIISVSWKRIFDIIWKKYQLWDVG